MDEARKEIEFIHLLPGTPFEQIRTLTENMLDEKHKHAFMLIEHARKSEKVPEKVAMELEQHSTNGLINMLIPIFVKGQEAGEFSEGDPRELLYWYFHIISSLIMQDPDNEGYGLPSADVLMRILTK